MANESEDGELGTVGSRNRDTDVEAEPSEWRFRAPYSVHANDGSFQALYEGGCHCGRIRYQLSREMPLQAKFCHCTTCQVLHGAPFQWAAIFHKEDINFARGHDDLGWYESGGKTANHKLPCKVSCSYCRSPIMDEGRSVILLFPSLIKFKRAEDKKKFYPKCHIFYGQRVVDVPDGLPKWTGMNDESTLIEDPHVRLEPENYELKETSSVQSE